MQDFLFSGHWLFTNGPDGSDIFVFRVALMRGFFFFLF